MIDMHKMISVIDIVFVVVILTVKIKINTF